VEECRVSYARSRPALPDLDVRLLGRFEVLRRGAPIPPEAWGRRKTRTLLKALLLEPGKVLLRDQLVEYVFDREDPGKALRNLHSRVSELRRVLEPRISRGSDSRYIVRRGEGYFFSTASQARIDTLEFENGIREALAAAEEKDWMAAIDRFEATLALYRDDFLAEDRYEEWIEPFRSRLRGMYLDSLARLAGACERQGRHRQAISCYQRLLQVEPYRESAVRQLMQCQLDAGYRAQALDTYRAGESAMRDYVDADPSPGLRALRDEIARGGAGGHVLDTRRVAVLPLQSYSRDSEDEYIADGLTEELIGSIAKVRDLRVVARTSVMRFKNTKKPVSQIARDLGVGTILEGSVRKVGQRLRVSAQLIDTATEDHLWAEHFDLDLTDVLEVQTEIARRTSEALKLKLLPREAEALRRTEAGTSEVHMAYLRGRFFLQKSTRGSLERAIRYFQEALGMDLTHARSLAGLADAWCAMVRYSSAEVGYARARKLAQRAVEIDPELAEAHCSLAAVVWGSDRDFDEAERLLRHAIALDPSCALAHASLASVLAVTDRVEDAIEASRHALSLDPVSPVLTQLHASCLYRAARFEGAIDQATKAIELDPERPRPWWLLWYSLGSTWDWDRAERVMRDFRARFPLNPLASVYLAMCIQCRGKDKEAIALMEEALTFPGAAEEATVLLYCGNGYYFARQFGKAEEFYRRVLELIPAHEAARILLAKCHLQRGEYEAAMEELDAAEETYGVSGEYWGSHLHMDRGRIHALHGETEKAERELDLLLEGATRQNRRLCTSVLLYDLGRVEEAMHWLEESVEAREPHLNALRKAPDFPEAMQAHPRFQALLRRVGLSDE
jgi:DNA-binding SARP family transcriptional activator/Tfp pilus assembly protein PilF